MAAQRLADFGLCRCNGAEMSAFQDFGIDASALDAERLVEWLRSRIQALLVEVKASPVWVRVMGDETPPSEVLRILQEVYLEIAMYQPDAVEAAIASIAQFPGTCRSL